MSPTGAIVVTTTAATPDAAAALAERLVEARLAACVQLTPIRSVYAWQGEVAQEGETLLTIKTRAALFPALEAAIRDGHAYETPEIIAVAVAHASADYLAWLMDSTDEAR